MKQKLHDANVEVDFGREETSHIERLGGRAEDLESVSPIAVKYPLAKLIFESSLFTRSEVG